MARHLADVEVELELLDVEPTTRRRHDPTDLLSVDGLSVSYGNRLAVTDVSLRVGRGEVVALIGHNGSGKSTTLSSVFGLVPHRSGDVVFSGVDLADAKQSRRADGIGFVPTSRPVFDDLSVRDNFVLAAATGRDRRQAAARIEIALDWFPSLRARLDIRAGRLSGGEQRMVALCLALVTEPRLLLLDEPTKQLAPRTIADLLRVIRALADERGTGVLVAETNVGAAVTVADRVYVMRSGRILTEHTGADLLAAGPSAWWHLF